MGRDEAIASEALLTNHHIPQQALGHICRVEALEKWQFKQPALFIS